MICLHTTISLPVKTEPEVVVVSTWCQKWDPVCNRKSTVGFKGRVVDGWQQEGVEEDVSSVGADRPDSGGGQVGER